MHLRRAAEPLKVDVVLATLVGNVNNDLTVRIGKVIFAGASELPRSERAWSSLSGRVDVTTCAVWLALLPNNDVTIWTDCGKRVAQRVVSKPCYVSRVLVVDLNVS